MKIKFSILAKVAIAYGILMLFWMFNMYISNKSSSKSNEIKNELTKVFQPSYKLIFKLSDDIFQSRASMEAVISSRIDSIQENDTSIILNLESPSYKEAKSKLLSLANLWEKEDKQYLLELFSSIDSMLFEQKFNLDKITQLKAENKDLSNREIVEIDKNVFLPTDRILMKINTLSMKLENHIDNKTTALLDSINDIEYVYIWAGVILFFVVLILSIATIRDIISPINKLRRTITGMSYGELPDKPIKVSKDEIGQMSKALNDLISGLKRLSAFSKEIGKENYNVEFEPLGENDELGNSLLLMRDNLKNAFREGMVRRKENFQRSWTSQGIAEFGEMLRESKDDLEKLTNQILTKLIRYLDASIGGLFIINDENKEDVFLELIAFYAFDRRKYLEKNIKIGESLVGQCVLENETIFMTEIPKDYIEITSGTGGDNPRSLLIVPLKLNEQVYGVVELASFKKIEQYQIEFVEKIGESIASTISSVKININTSKLLQESKEKSKRLSKQEEESRKQIEDMEKSIETLKNKINNETEEHQEAVTKLQTELLSLRKLNDKYITDNDKLVIDVKNISKSTDNAAGTFSLSINEEFIEANNKYLKMIEMSLTELKELKLSDLIAENSNHNNFMPTLLMGNTHQQKTKYTINNESKWFFETYTPLYDEHGKFSKIFCIVIDETELTQTKIEQEAMIEKLKSDVRKLKERII